MNDEKKGTVSNAHDLCETELIRLAREMVTAYHKYNPGGDYLAFCYVDGHFDIHNIWWKDDQDSPIKMKGRWGK